MLASAMGMHECFMPSIPRTTSLLRRVIDPQKKKKKLVITHRT